MRFCQHSLKRHTIAVTEAVEGVIWSKPDDLPFGGAVPALGEKGWDHTPAIVFDGSVFMCPTKLKADRFWPSVAINGGEVAEDLDDDHRRRPPLGGQPVAQPPK